jgi:hypothetical protein
MLVNVPRLITAYYTDAPDPAVPAHRVAFGTSGHRGSSFRRSFNEWHILAITQAIYAESFQGAEHLHRILEEAQTLVSDALSAAPVPQQGKGRTSSALHQQTVSEAKEERRNEGNPN